MIAENTNDLLPPVAVYNTGRPGMPIKAVFPTAAPVHDGAAIALNAAWVVGVALRLNDKTEPSLRLNEKFCPAPERAVASLYVLKSSQQ